MTPVTIFRHNAKLLKTLTVAQQRIDAEQFQALDQLAQIWNALNASLPRLTRANRLPVKHIMAELLETIDADIATRNDTFNRHLAAKRAPKARGASKSKGLAQVIQLKVGRPARRQAA